MRCKWKVRLMQTPTVDVSIGYTLNIGGSDSREFVSEFWSLVRRLPDDCWEWQGPIYDGYGRFCRKGQKWQAHRLAWVLAHGPIPDGMLVLHKNECHNRACCNPE